MEGLGAYLSKFKNLHAPNEAVVTECVRLCEDVAGVRVLPHEVSIQRNMITLHLHPTKHSQVLRHKRTILNELNHTLKRSFQNLY